MQMTIFFQLDSLRFVEPKESDGAVGKDEIASIFKRLDVFSAVYSTRQDKSLFL